LRRSTPRGPSAGVDGPGRWSVVIVGGEGHAIQTWRTRLITRLAPPIHRRKGASRRHVRNKQLACQYSGIATDYSDLTVMMTGSTSTGTSGSSFSYSVSNTYSESFTDYGDVTVGGVVSPYSESIGTSATYRYSVTGPPDSTTYQVTPITASEPISVVKPEPPGAAGEGSGSQARTTHRSAHMMRRAARGSSVHRTRLWPQRRYLRRWSPFFLKPRFRA
jgi:hypothetical protein